MPKEYVVKLENRPGTFADLLEVIGRAGVNVLGIECQTLGEYGTVHFVVSDEAKTEDALRGADLNFRAFDVFPIRIPNRPGELGRTCRRLSEAGVNIEGIFGTTSIHGDEAEFMLKVHDIPAARKALGFPDGQ